MTPRHVAAAACSAFLVLLCSACQDLGPSQDYLLEDIATHRVIWESRRPSAYVYELERFCNCTEEARGPVRVRVRGMAVVERRYTASGAAVASSLEGVFPSVEGLFDLLEEAAKRDPWYINMNWDPDLGYPRDLYVDFESNVIDDEVSYKVVTAPSADGGA